MEFWYTEQWTGNTRFSIKVRKQLHSETTPFQQIDVFDSYDYGRFFTLDGLMMVTEKDEFIYHDMIVHVPMAVNPCIRRVLVIGGGDGGTVRELTRYPGISSIDMVEIDERVVRISQEYFPSVSCGLSDRRVNLMFADGLEFVRNSPSGEYDLIIVDSTDPIGPGEGLFTNDFYTGCRRVLGDDGILVNQNESPYFPYNSNEMKRAYQKIRGSFEIAMPYQAFIPTYPSGHWMFGFASKKYHPLSSPDFDKWNALGLQTKYYNTDLHKGSFALPNYVHALLNENGSGENDKD